MPIVGRGAFLLGIAGLLPAAAATALIGIGRPAGSLALAYPLLILSFLGGIWWGFAMRRTRHQAVLAAIAVVPSLVALMLYIIMATVAPVMPWVLVATGTAVLLTLFVDRRLVADGSAPEGWMALRVPLSVGLGGLTIVSGYLMATIIPFPPAY